MDPRDDTSDDLPLVDRAHNGLLDVSRVRLAASQPVLEDPAHGLRHDDAHAEQGADQSAGVGDRIVDRILWRQGRHLHHRPWRGLPRARAGGQLHRRRQRNGARPDHDHSAAALSAADHEQDVGAKRARRSDGALRCGHRGQSIARGSARPRCHGQLSLVEESQQDLHGIAGRYRDRPRARGDAAAVVRPHGDDKALRHRPIGFGSHQRLENGVQHGERQAAGGRVRLIPRLYV